MAAPRKYSQNVRDRAVRLVTDLRAEDPGLSLNGAATQVSARVKVGVGTLRKWVLQADVERKTTSDQASSLVESARSGSRLAALRDLRDVLVATLMKTDSARDVAALSRQITDVLAQIEAVEKAAPEAKGTPLDELEKRRAARQPGSSGRAGAAGGVVAR